jgi:hypothetical protein
MNFQFNTNVALAYNYWLHASPDYFLYPIRYDIINTHSIIPDEVQSVK